MLLESIRSNNLFSSDLGSGLNKSKVSLTCGSKALLYTLGFSMHLDSLFITKAANMVSARGRVAGMCGWSQQTSGGIRNCEAGLLCQRTVILSLLTTGCLKSYSHLYCDFQLITLGLLYYCYGRECDKRDT